MDEQDEVPEFDPSELDTGNRLVVITYGDGEGVEVENPHDLPYHEVLGLLHVAVAQWTADHDWIDVEGWDPDE